MNFNNLPLARKLGVGFGAVLVVVAASSIFTFVRVQQVAEIERLNSVSDTVMDDVDRADSALNSVRASVRKFVLTGAASDKAQIQTSLAEITKQLGDAEAILAKDGPDLLPNLKDYHNKIDVYVQKIFTVETDLASDPATRPQAIALVSSAASAPYSATVDAAFEASRERLGAWADLWTRTGNEAMAQIEWIVAVSGLLSILIGLAMAWVIMRSVGRPLTSMTEAMRRLAGGDNGVEIPGHGQKDEIGRMAGAVQVFKEAAIEKLRLEREAGEARRQAEEHRARGESERAEAAKQQAHVVETLASGLERLSEGDLVFRLSHSFAPEYEKLRSDFNGATDKLQESMKVVVANTVAIRSGTSEISTASDDLSRRTEQQAASLEETAAALDEITATVKKTSDSASHARQVVSTAKTDAEHSGEVVRRAVAAMNAIETSSNQISQIIGVIDEIAFQTNLLALNAGVEAARAGDAGRGFAVVASEVRGLAQRSAEAAKEIKSLISTSTQQVGEGVGLVGETGKALERIVQQVAEINLAVSDIAASTQEQATALQQVNTAINQMDQVTQQNAAMVEESTAASHSLAQETEELARVMARFQVGQGATVERLAARRPAGRATVPAMRTTGRGGAARKPEADAGQDDWQEF